MHLQDTRSVVISMTNLSGTFWEGFGNNGCLSREEQDQVISTLCRLNNGLPSTDARLFSFFFYHLCPPAVMDPPEERSKCLDWLNSRRA